ncbi:hypothetical protein HG530_007110 [Fusarium avenaceum]|nr:hypothetical protein HG530_007110 [Fusarium avenaceum]
MEVAGFAIGVIGIAGLFNTCLDSLARFQSYRSANAESHLLDTRFRAARARFEQWGVGVGISNGKLLPDHHPGLDNKDTTGVIEDVLHIITKVICDNANAHSRLPDGSYTGPTQPRRKRLKWALGGKADRVEQVDVFEKLVQQLYNLVHPKGEEYGCEDRLLSHTWAAEMRQMLTKLEERMKAENRREVYSWLGKIPPDDKYEDSAERRVENTCDWVLDRPFFTSWMGPEDSSGLKLLWIHAPAGFGKTILCAHIIQHLSSALASPVAHFFFTSDHGSREGPFVALRSWISQIAAQNEDVFQRVHEAWETDSAETASRRTLIELFSAITHSVPGCIFVADGLDECFQLGNEDSSIARFLSDVISAVADSSAKFLFTSRDEPEIRSALENSATDLFTEYRVLPEDVQADTAVFSQSIVNTKLSNKSDDIRTSISEAMTERCEGQFLWIKMQEESLRKGMSKKRLHEVVENSPSGLDRLYDHNWKKILDMSEWERNRVFALLRWATFAMRPLNVYEITEAVLIAQFEELDPEEYPDSIDDDYIRTEIIGLCGPLLEIRDDPDWPAAGFKSVHLPHFSVRQYLSQRLPIPNWIHDNGQLQTHYERTQHTALVKSCIQYINLPQVWADTIDHGARYKSFRHYIVGFWCSHARLAFEDPSIVELCDALLTEDNPIYCSLAQYEAVCIDEYVGEEPEGPRAPTSPLQKVLTSSGWTFMAKRLINDSNKNKIGHLGRSPTHFACLGGLIEVVQQLLEAGVDLTIKDSEGNTPLIISAHKGFNDIVELLLTHGADVSAQNLSGYTALHMAAWKGQTKCCEYLIEGGASLTAKSHREESPLNLACMTYGQSDTVRLLLQNGPETLATERSAMPRSPLQWVCNSGDVDTAKVLLEFGAAKSLLDLNEEGLPPLALAAYHGHVELVKLLLDHGGGLTISIAGDNGYTILHLLSAAGANDEMMRLLLGSVTKSCLSMVSDDGNTPLHNASYSGHVNIVRLILEYEAQNVQLLLQVRGNYLQTPLFCAAISGHHEVVKELLKNGAETTLAIPEMDGYAPLCIASCLGHGDIVERLLAYGAAKTIAVTSSGGSTPLFVASTNGHTRVVKQLLAHGAATTVACKTQGGDTALLAAVYKGRAEIVEVLLSHGVQNAVAIPDSGGATPLAAACLFRFAEIVKLLLDHGAESTITLADNNQRTPLFKACTVACVEIVKLLLGHEAEATIETLDLNGDSPLYAATSGGWHDIVLELLAHGARASLLVANKQGMKPLYTAAGMGDAKLVKLYLDILQTMDQDQINQKTHYGMTPLFVASRFGHLEVVKLLVSTSCIDLNCENWMGLTPLVTAVINGHLEVARLLISRGATVSSRVPIGRCLIWWARRTNDKDLVQLVESQETAADVSLFDAHTQFEEPSCDATQVSYEAKATWCCICTLSITNGQVYTCEECKYHMNNRVCSECFDRGFRLCQSSHALILRSENASWNILMI